MILVLGLVCTTLPLVLMLNSLRYLKAQLVSLVSCMEPVYGILLGSAAVIGMAYCNHVNRRVCHSGYRCSGQCVKGQVVRSLVAVQKLGLLMGEFQNLGVELIETGFNQIIHGKDRLLTSS